MLDALNKLNKDQKGIAALIAGTIIFGFGLGLIPGISTILTLSGLGLIGLGLYTLEVHTKIIALVKKQ